jgi:pyrroline-5-carboxylate reductase
MPTSCGFIGGGMMAEALLGGFLAKSVFTKENMMISDLS